MVARAEMDTAKILPARSFSNFLKSPYPKGFTLLEVMVVLGILGAVLAVGLPRFRQSQNNIKQVVRQLSSITREVRNQARMKRMTYRIAFRLADDKPAYWIENAPGNVLVPSQTTLDAIEHMDEKERPANPFQKVTKFFKTEKPLPTGMYFGSVETPSVKSPVTEGMAYVYFSPEGLVEKAIVQITNKKDLTWSLLFNPLTGHSDVVEKAISAKDLNFD